MSNFYGHTSGLPINQSRGISAQIRSELDAISSSFLLLTVIDDTGIVNAYTATSQSSVVAYSDGQPFNIRAVNANTGAATVNINGIGAVAIVRPDGLPLQAGDIQAGQIFGITYNGSISKFQLTTNGMPWIHQAAIDFANAIYQSTFKVLAVDADAFGIIDSEDGYALKQFTIAALKSMWRGGNSYTGAQNYARATVASHATTGDVWGAAGNVINWTGTATCTSFPAAPQAGASRVLVCAGACSFTASATMVIDGVTPGQSVTCAAGDRVEVVADPDTTHFRLHRERVDGKAQVVTCYSEGTVSFTGAYASSFTVPGAYTYTLPSASSTLLATNGSAAGLTNFPTLNQNTSGTAANLSGTPTLPTGTTLVAPVLGTPASGNLSNCTKDGTNGVGYLNIPQNSKSADYTFVLADAGEHILHPSADTTARTFTIPANGSVPFPIGTAITVINQNGAGVLTIAITSDTMRKADSGTTGSRTLAANGIVTILKVTATEWLISGGSALT